MKRKLALLLAFAMLFGVLAACGSDDGDTATPAPGGSSTDNSGSADNSGSTDNSGSADGSDYVVPDDPGGFYEFTMFWNYDWTNDYMDFGKDAVSRWWGEMFDVHMNTEMADLPGDEAINLRIAANDLPDSIWMERGDTNQRMARLGLFIPINDMKVKAGNTWYDDYVGSGTQAFFEIDGVNYIIPNWARQGEMGVRGGATGGNNAWMYTTAIYDAVGSPEIKNLDDLFNYASLVRDAGLSNYGGSPVIPLLFHGGDTDGGVNFVNQALFPVFGGHTEGDWYYKILEDGTYGLAFRSAAWREAVLEANAWYRAGLIPETNLTNTLEEFIANMSNGRGGLIWYDQSHDDTYQFRKILREADPGNSIEMFISEDSDGWKGVLFPSPQLDLQVKDLYHHVYSTLGWNGAFITKQAENPVRIFNFLCHHLTLQGAIEEMYGPPGYIYDEIHPDGYPIIHTPDSSMTAEQIKEIGAWNWNFLGASNYWDSAKFAADGALPEDQRSWVITNQREYFTPNMMLSNEFEAMNLVIDPTSDLGISRTTIDDRFQEMFRQIFTAGSRAECIQMLDDFLAFAEANNVAEIEKAYNEQYMANKALQGGFGLTPAVLPSSYVPRDVG